MRPALFQVNRGNRREVSLDKLVMLAPVSWPGSSLGNDYILSILSPPAVFKQVSIPLHSTRKGWCVGGLLQGQDQLWACLIPTDSRLKDGATPQDVVPEGGPRQRGQVL